MENLQKKLAKLESIKSELDDANGEILDLKSDLEQKGELIEKLKKEMKTLETKQLTAPTDSEDTEGLSEKQKAK